MCVAYKWWWLEDLGAKSHAYVKDKTPSFAGAGIGEVVETWLSQRHSNSRFEVKELRAPVWNMGHRWCFVHRDKKHDQEAWPGNMTTTTGTCLTTRRFQIVCMEQGHNQSRHLVQYQGTHKPTKTWPLPDNKITIKHDWCRWWTSTTARKQYYDVNLIKWHV